MNKKLLSILNQNPVKNISIIDFFSSNSITEYYIEGNSAIIYGKSDQIWAHISSSSETELSVLLSKHHNKTKYYYSFENWMLPLILKYGTEDWRMTTNKFKLDENIKIDLPKSNVIRIDKSFAPIIYENSDYRTYTSIEYIEERLTKDISAGIFKNNKLIAWGFTHDDGSLGGLHVLKEFRNKGYAVDILFQMIHLKRKEKKHIYGNILLDNIASTNLSKKLGFKFVCQSSWIKLK